MKKLLMFIILLTIPYLLFSENITIYGEDGLEKTISVDSTITELKLSKTVHQIIHISGLENLAELKKIEIAFSDISLIDSATWKSMQQIEEIEINYCTSNNLSFIQYLPNLTIFSLVETNEIQDGCYLNLQNNIKLEKLVLHGFYNEDYPVIDFVPESLRSIDIRGSSFTQNTEDQFLTTVSENQIELIVNKRQYQYFQTDKKYDGIILTNN